MQCLDEPVKELEWYPLALKIYTVSQLDKERERVKEMSQIGWNRLDGSDKKYRLDGIDKYDTNCTLQSIFEDRLKPKAPVDYMGRPVTNVEEYNRLCDRMSIESVPQRKHRETLHNQVQLYLMMQAALQETTDDAYCLAAVINSELNPYTLRALNTDGYTFRYVIDTITGELKRRVCEGLHKTKQ
jgi:hypothetical protein